MPGLLGFFENIGTSGRELGGLLRGMTEDLAARAQANLTNSQRALKNPNDREAIDAAINAALNSGGLLAMTFAGVGAKTADILALDKAKKLTAAGVDPVQVWQTTGWTDQFPDKQWRFEIPDNLSKVKIDPVQWDVSGRWGATHPAPVAKLKPGSYWEYETPKGQAAYDAARRKAEQQAASLNTVDKVLEHQKLMEAYPDVMKGKLEIGGVFDPYWGQYNSIDDLIQMSPSLNKQQMRSGLLHELQHAVQAQEGFSNGAMATDSLYWHRAGEVEARLAQARRNLTAAQRRARPPWLEFSSSARYVE